MYGDLETTGQDNKVVADFKVLKELRKSAKHLWQ